MPELRDPSAPAHWPHVCPCPSTDEGPMIEETTEGSLYLPSEITTPPEQHRWRCHDCGAWGGKHYPKSVRR